MFTFILKTCQLPWYSATKNSFIITIFLLLPPTSLWPCFCSIFRFHFFLFPLNFESIQLFIYKNWEVNNLRQFFFFISSFPVARCQVSLPCILENDGLIFLSTDFEKFSNIQECFKRFMKNRIFKNAFSTKYLKYPNMVMYSITGTTYTYNSGPSRPYCLVQSFQSVEVSLMMLTSYKMT